ncbi:MAG: fibronectin type III domain-containing protein [Candidatus Magasanikbacteria bacterium]|nr:fibronectin type III domain-containing protein [Candidatus Magasanikbacteria bacterium]
MVHQRHRILQSGIVGALVLGGFVATGFLSTILAQTSGSCSLAANSAYRASNSRGVYYIADDCTKRPIRDQNVFFSHFSSWNDVNVVSPATLAAIPDSALLFLPWGPLRAFQNGSLLKTVDDPQVYIISNNKRRPISSEQVFTGLGLQWNWVEDVVPSVMQQFSIGDQVASATTYPDGLTVKYSDSPRVYVLETSNGQTERQYAPTMESLQNYRADHIITLPSNRVFPDKSTPLPTPVTPVAPVAPANPTTPVRTPAAPLSLVLSNVTDSSITLTWRDRSSDETGFVVQRRFGRTGSFSDVATVNANIVTYVDSGLSANQYYGYRVRAVNSRGDSAYTNEAGTTTRTATVVTPAPTTTPATPPPQATNVAPTVSLTSPSNNTSVTAGTSVSLIATATDSDGTITSVEFLNGSTVLGSDATSPYSFTWTNVQSGTYTLTARATDNSAAQTVSSPVSLTVNSATVPVTPPPVSGGSQVNSANTNSSMGTNVTQFREWASEFTFKDAFRRARNWTCSGSCTYDANGWPTSGRASTVLFTGGANFLNGKYPSGQYVVLYEGTGTISYSGSAVKNTAASRVGRDIIDVNSSNGSLNITVDGSVRNIRVIMPGGDCGDIFTYAASASECSGGNFRSNEQTYESQPFHSLYLQRNKNYKSIRFMWWMLPVPYVQTPRLTAAISWSQRPKMTDAIWVGDGVPVEAMVQLANTLNADPWFTFPHLSNDLVGNNPSDAYVAQFATYVRDHLNSNLKAYIEYSNEVWNGGPGGYEQAEHARERGLALGLGTTANSYLAQLRFQSQQSVKMFRIWDQVYGGHSSRVVRVLAARSDGFSNIASIETNLCGKTGSLNYPWSSAQLLAWQSAFQDADAIAIAPYFNVLPNDESRIGSGTLDQLFSYINDTLIPVNTQQIQANAALARDCGKELVAYEGGQHLVERGTNQNNANEVALYNNANRDARIGAVYTSLLNAWKQNGGHLFEHFVNTMQQSSGGVGRFGALESLLDSSSPKYDAIMNFIRQNPKWW